MLLSLYIKCVPLYRMYEPDMIYRATYRVKESLDLLARTILELQHKSIRLGLEQVNRYKRRLGRGTFCERRERRNL